MLKIMAAATMLAGQTANTQIPEIIQVNIETDSSVLPFLLEAAAQGAQGVGELIGPGRLEVHSRETDYFSRARLSNWLIKKTVSIEGICADVELGSQAILQSGANKIPKRIPGQFSLVLTKRDLAGLVDHPKPSQPIAGAIDTANCIAVLSASRFSDTYAAGNNMESVTTYFAKHLLGHLLGIGTSLSGRYRQADANATAGSHCANECVMQKTIDINRLAEQAKALGKQSFAGFCLECEPLLSGRSKQQLSVFT